MARVKYREHLQMVEAVQNKGTNFAELVEFAPELITQDGEGKVWCATPMAGVLLPVNVTDWLIDDYGIGYIIPITDKAFGARFDAAPH